MPAAKTPAEAAKLPGSPHDSAPKAARERRESEQLITDWEQETTQLGRALALMTLDVSAMPSEKWAHRFIISLRCMVEEPRITWGRFQAPGHADERRAGSERRALSRDR